LKEEERMFKKIPQRSLPSSHIICLKESLKERKKRPRLKRREKEIHLALITRGMVMMMSTVGNYIWRKDQSYSTTKTVSTVQQDLGFDSGDEEKITVVGVQGKGSLHAISSYTNESHDDERKRNELFHIRVVSKHTNIDTLFDPGSQVNLISESLVKKMSLERKAHPKPYPLGWVWDKEKINVTKNCRVRFSIASKLVDEVYLDVVSLDICGIVLGSPYLYERKAVFFHNENKYHLTKGGVEYIVRAHNMKVNTTLVSAGQMKRLINTNNRYVLMVVREKDV
jgi:hypothetical protein